MDSVGAGNALKEVFADMKCRTMCGIVGLYGLLEAAVDVRC